MMRVVHDEPKIHGRVTLQFGLSGDRDQVQAQSSKHRFLPDLLIVEYRLSRTGVWLENGWTLHGPRVLADGGTSVKIRLKRDGYFGRTSVTYNVAIPTWVMEVAEKYRPGNTPTEPKASNDTTLIY